MSAVIRSRECFSRDFGLIALAAAVVMMPILLAAQAKEHPVQAQASEGKETVLPELVVSGAKEKSATPREGSAESGYHNTANQVGPLGNAKILDTPYSIHATSGELIENREVHTEFDALETNPAVSNLMVPNGYSSLSRIMVRGFTAADAGDLRDGVVDRSFTYVPLENVEKIEVLNGVSSFLYGFTAVGGAVNYVSKQPTPDPFAALSYGYYGGGINYLHADLGGPVAGTDKKLATRVNAYREDGNTYMQDGSQWRTLLSETTTLKVLPSTVLKSDAYFQDYAVHSLTTYINAPSNNWTSNKINVPNASQYDATTQYGQSYTFNRSRKTVVGLGLDSKLSDIFALRTAYRYGKMWREYSYVDAILQDNAGDYTEKYDITPRQNETTHADYALLDSSFETGPVHHDLTFGMTNYYYRYTRGEDNFVTLGTSNIAKPVKYAKPTVDKGPVDQVYNEPERNVVLGDRVKFGDKWLGLLGVNYAQLQDEEWDVDDGNFYQGQHAFTPTLGLTWKPKENVSAYGSYMQALKEGGQAPDTAVNANKLLPPSVSTQYEVGSKAEIAGSQVTLALFRIHAVNEYTDPTDNVYKQDGVEIHQGIELSDTGKITHRLTVTGGLMLMRARVERQKNNTALQGKIPVNIPEQQVRLYAEYHVPHFEALTPTFNINYSGRRPVDSTNLHFFDGSTLCDAGLRYEPKLLHHKAMLNINVTNIGNKHYWTYYRSGDGLQLGEPRVVAFSLKGQW